MRALGNRIVNMVSRFVLALANDATKMQAAQISILDSETRDDVERFQQYGFTSVPLPGAEGIVIFVGGARDHPLITNIDDRRHRMRNLEPGEVAIYTDEGDFIHIKRGGEIHVKAATKLYIDTPLVHITGDVQIDGASGMVVGSGHVQDFKGTMEEMRQIYNGHTHPETQATTQIPNQPMT
jgi:phage baseplate assembly protein V